jgi:hypothetical protein
LKLQSFRSDVTIYKKCYIAEGPSAEGNLRFAEEVTVALKKAASESRPKSFLVRMIDRQNATWQGTVMPIDQNAARFARLPLPLRADGVSMCRETLPFRSALELFHLIDSALEEEESAARPRAAK